MGGINGKGTGVFCIGCDGAAAGEHALGNDGAGGIYSHTDSMGRPQITFSGHRRGQLAEYIAVTMNREQPQLHHRTGSSTTFIGWPNMG